MLAPVRTKFRANRLAASLNVPRSVIPDQVTSNVTVAGEETPSASELGMLPKSRSASPLAR